jgi:hypothetical protein
MKSIKTFIYSMTLLITVVSCDEHRDFPDTAMKPCHVLCTDGKVTTYETCNELGKTPIAVVFNINQSEKMEGTGYAVFLHDLYPSAFADTISVKQNTSADITAYDGNVNTYKMFTTKDVESPLAESVFSVWTYGQSAYIPSVAQMRLLYESRCLINPIIIKCGGDPIPEAPDECWYWTSTEVKGQETVKAWLFSLGSGALQETPKDQAHKARPIITLYN